MMIVSLSAKKNINSDMTAYKNSDLSLCFKEPSYMQKNNEDNSSISFEGKGKFVNLMLPPSGNNWDIEKFSKMMTNDSDNLTLVEKNDTLRVYKI